MTGTISIKQAYFHQPKAFSRGTLIGTAGPMDTVTLSAEALNPYHGLAADVTTVTLDPEEVLEASGLSGARVIKNRAVPTYFCCDGAEPCNFGLVEIVGDQLERGPISTLPRQVYDLADQAVAYFIPRETSKALTQAAFHAHQAGYSSHATYLARKASEFDPENSVAQRSLEALKAKGIQENGDERSCLDSLWAKHGSPLAILANRGFSLD